MTSNYFNVLLFSWLLAGPVMAAKSPLSSLCDALSGSWQGTSAESGQSPKPSSIQAVCSADGLQLYIALDIQGHDSETWWFTQQQHDVRLLLGKGDREPVVRNFSLYQQEDSFSLLGQGEVAERPALIRLIFESVPGGWQWLQQVQFLDNDFTDYQVVRGIELSRPAAD
ncbi:MAG: hypothetical protein LPD71_01010 [Shewanella sp.]|nr:hypothetical protein [Shewanella sp.]MCF1431298.1 hypothetical protein [Shewanella sp.]MCF1437370.1 hypothetical protein [Shewanella sp.]MCF1457652.1 hypothetical protein [Shewanella sp.]